MKADATSRGGTREHVLALLDEGYDRKSWHGTNLRGSLRRVTAAQAGWRPRGGIHSIADITVHCAYWKYAARRRLTGEKRGSFPLKGSNWFRREAPLTEAAWRACVALLDAQHAALRDAIRTLAPARWAATPPGSKVSTAMLLRGVALHDVYHAGQIQTLKGLRQRTR
jgi:uncharacterized damage-inducible protein DinB